MLRRIQNSFVKPFPFSTGWKSELRLSLIFIGIIALILKKYLNQDYILWVSIAGVIFGDALYYFIKYGIVARYIDKVSWKLYQSFLLSLVQLVLISFSIYLGLVFNHFVSYDFSLLLETILYTVLIAAIPMALSFHLQYAVLLKQNLKKASEFETGLKLPEDTLVKANAITCFSSSVVKERLEIETNKLLYLESNQNYILVVAEDSKPILFRQPLKEAIAQSELTKCHRSFAVNLDNVSSVKGNSQGLFFEMKNGSKVPVSRTYQTKLKEVILKKKSKI